MAPDELLRLLEILDREVDDDGKGAGLALLKKAG